MSTFGQAIGGIFGGFVGFLVGGPTGALYGFQIGVGVGSLVDPTQLPGASGPRLTDTRTTTARVGDPVNEVFGTDVVAGTVIYLGAIDEQSETEEVGGKGGGGQEVTTYTYFQTIAIGLCLGEMGGLLRIWENGKLVYDVRDQLVGETEIQYDQRITAALEYAEGFELYFGTEDQLPSPTIEAERGIGTVPAYRGLMYIVYVNRELRQDQGLRHPNFKFEVSTEPSIATLNRITFSAGQIYFTGGSIVDDSFGWTLGYPEIEDAGDYIAGITTWQGYTISAIRAVNQPFPSSQSWEIALEELDPFGSAPPNSDTSFYEVHIYVNDVFHGRYLRTSSASNTVDRTRFWSWTLDPDENIFIEDDVVRVEFYLVDTPP